MIDFEVSNSTASIIRGRLPGESSCGPAGSVHRLGNVHSVDIVIEVTLREGSRNGTTKIKLQQVPKFLINAFDFINCHGMDQEGLFRREGNASRLNQNNWAVYMGSAPIPANFSVHDVCTMVKRFFRDLKEPLLSGAGLRDRLIELVKKNQVAPVTRQEFAAVFEPEINPGRKNVSFCLSRAHLGTLGYLMRQLHRIAHNSCKHQMTSLNLATVFAPTLFRDEVPKDKLKRKERRGSQDDILLNVREDTQSRIEAIQLLIEHANWIGLHPNCYLTSAHPRSSSAAPSPRQPPFVNVANLKEPPYVDRKYSLKEHTRQSAKTAERRASSTFRFITDKFVRKRSPSKDRTKLNSGVLRHSTNRRASSPAIVVPNELRTKDAKHERKTPTRYVLDFGDPAVVVAQPSESHNGRSRDALRSAGARASRPRQHQSQSTTNSQQKTKAVPSQSTGRATRYTVDSNVTTSVVRRDSGKKRHFSPTVRASKVLKDTPASLASREHFLSSYGEGRERSRRRHTTPVKTNTALRRNQPNTLHSGLQQPKRRATVVNASEQEKENRSQEVSASSSCEDIESTINVDDNSTMLTDSSADLLTQKGHESRLRRAKRQQRRELSSILQQSLLDSSTLQESSFFTKDRVKESRNLVSTACSPIIFPASPSETKPQRAHGSAIVGETIVISTGPMLSPSSDEPSINLPTDLNTTPAPPKPTTVPPIKNHYHSMQTPSGTVTTVTKQMAPKAGLTKSYGDSSKAGPHADPGIVFRQPSLPPQPEHREEVCTNTFKLVHVSRNESKNTFVHEFICDRHMVNTKQPLSRLAKPFALAFPRSTSMTTSFDSAISGNHSFAKSSKILSPERVTPNEEPKDGLTSDDDMFACSNQMKSAILNATSELDINVHMDRQLRCRPSVALIEKQGIVRERVNQFRRLGNVASMPLEPISGRSSGLSSRSSIGTGSVAGDEEFVKPTAPPVTHSLNMAFDRQQADVSLFDNIHKEFRELVDTLVECFCADSNIPLEQLRAELKSVKADQLTLHQKTSLEPVAAAQDFNVFVPMMMRKNVELQLQALQMIEFMCGLIPSVLQIEEGESFKNKARIISPEETERYVLIAVMRQSKEEFDNLSRREMEELEEVLRSSVEERRRLEEDRAREQALMSKALAITDGTQPSDGQKRLEDTAVCATGIEMHQRSEPSEEVDKAITKASRDISEVKIQRTPSAKKGKRGSISERPPSPKIPAPTEKEQNEISRAKSPALDKPADEAQNAERPSTKKEGRPPTTKRPNSKERRASLQGPTKERRPSTEARKRKDESKTGKKTANGDEDEGVWQGPRTKNVYDVNALLQEPSRLNSAQLRSRAEYLRMQRDRLLALKASEREKQMNEVSQRAAQERPRTAKAARGLMRGSRGGIDHDDVLAARREIVEKLKTEIDGKAGDA